MCELRSGLFFFGLSLLVLWESLRVELGTFLEPGSGFLSFCVGLVLSGLSIVLIYRGWGVRESQKPHSRHVILALTSLFIYSFVGRLKKEASATMIARNQHELMRALEVLNLIELGELICVAAMERKETRGWHERKDYPYKDPLLDKSLVMKRVDGKPVTYWR